MPQLRKFYEEVVVVEGSGEFPIDMLRFDSACPDRETDSFALVQIGKRQVQLRRYGRNNHGPNADRWRSFGWKVVSVEERT